MNSWLSGWTRSALLTIITIAFFLMITFIVGYFTNIHWSDVAFFVAGSAVFFGYFFSTSKRASLFSKGTKSKTNLEEYRKHTYKFKMNPFFIAAIIYLILSFIFPFVV